MAQTKEQIDRSNRLACGYSIIRAADIHQFLGLSMLSQKLHQCSAKALHRALPKPCKSSARSSVRSSAKALSKALPKALQHLCPPSVLATQRNRARSAQGGPRGLLENKPATISRDETCGNLLAGI